jgi:H+/gluconate symporter-like permease
MESLSVVGIVVALALLMFLAMRGFSVLVIAPFCAIIVALTSGIPLMEGLGGAYMEGLGGFVIRFFLVFMLGALFGKYMEDSGAALSISNSLLNLTGRDKPYRALISIMIICAVLTYGGVNLFVIVFSVIPLARPIFKALNIEWGLLMAPIALGAATFTMTMVPGTPALTNIIPMSYLGTHATAAPLVGLVASIVVIFVGCWYMKIQINKSQREGKGYEEPSQGVGQSTTQSVIDNNKPNVLLSLVPPVVLLIAMNIFKVNVVIALVLGIVVAAILFSKYIPNQLMTLNKGASNAIMPLFNTCAVVGFGSIVAITAGFAVISSALLSIPGSPLISLTIATNILAGVNRLSFRRLGHRPSSIGTGLYRPGFEPRSNSSYSFDCFRWSRCSAT